MLETHLEPARSPEARQAQRRPHQHPCFEEASQRFQCQPRNQACGCNRQNCLRSDLAVENCSLSLGPASLKHPARCRSAAECSSPVPLNVVFHNRVDSSHSVFPINLLALPVSPSAIRNSDFINATASLRELSNDFWLDAKLIFFKLNRF